MGIQRQIMGRTGFVPYPPAIRPHSGTNKLMVNKPISKTLIPCENSFGVRRGQELHVSNVIIET